ncbi:MAG: dihydrodipicolinate synthase family protein [Thermoanaerobaculia bacterium]
MKWQGVFPAITTPFRPDLSVDHNFLRKHVDWMIRAGCRGIVTGGSLGEAATLTRTEKIEILKTCAETIAGRLPLVAGISALSTAEAVELARAAKSAGCTGLMALPVYVYRGDWRETEAHFRAILTATNLPCMLYNNPVAYGTDVTPEQIANLAELPNLEAVKESSMDVRRITAIRERLGSRLAIFVGVDDVILEGVQAGAVGWIAGLVNALPEESVRLFDLAVGDRREEARTLYEWFLPLLRLDTVPKFVQLIKLVQAEVGMGTETVRPPRLALTGEEREAALTLIRERLARRPGRQANRR